MELNTGGNFDMKKRTIGLIAFIYVLALGFGMALGKIYAVQSQKNVQAVEKERNNPVETTTVENKQQDINDKNQEIKLPDKEKDTNNQQNQEAKNNEQDKQKQEQNKNVANSNVDVKNKQMVKEAIKREGKKVAYLTFDDGPSKDITPKVLEILKENNIKATFFIVGEMAKANPDLIKRIYEEGHSISNHSYSHEYSYIYSSPDAILKEIKETEDVVKHILGEKYQNRFFRFPGGSYGRPENIKEAVVNNGYLYIDWNCLTGDAEGKVVSVEKQYNKFLSTVGKKIPLLYLCMMEKAKEVHQLF